MGIVLASPYRSLHYTGSADEGLMRALLADRERLEISAMDMPNRWGGATRFFWDEFESCGMPYPECPDWLEHVTFYQEGAADHDIALRDWPWGSPHQFRKIVAFTGQQPPRLVLLFGLADLGTVHRSYHWERREGLTIGRWREGYRSAFDPHRALRRLSSNTGA